LPGDASLTSINDVNQSTENRQADRDTATQVIFQGDFYGWDEYIEERVIGGITSAVKERDVVIIDNESRNGRNLTESIQV